LLGEDMRITRDRGVWQLKKGVWFMPTFHPAALLRDEDKKRPAWEDFKAIVEKFGYTATAVPVTEGLHLKDFVIYLEKGNMLVTPTMNEQPAFAEYNRFVVDADELYAINSMNINGTVIVPEGFPKTLKTIQDLGYPTVVINNSEFAKIDGSLTCLSLRF